MASYLFLASISLLSNAFKLVLHSKAGNSLHLLLANYQHDYLAMLDAITGPKSKQGDNIWGDRQSASELSRGQKCVSPVTQMDLACAWPVNNHSTLHKLLQASAVDPRGKPALSALSPGNEHSVLVEQRESRGQKDWGIFWNTTLSHTQALELCIRFRCCQWCTCGTW